MNTIDEHKQTIAEFLKSPAFEYARNEYNKATIQKLVKLNMVIQNCEDHKIYVASGSISGFKEGFDFLETISKKEVIQ